MTEMDFTRDPSKLTAIKESSFESSNDKSSVELKGFCGENIDWLVPQSRESGKRKQETVMNKKSVDQAMKGAHKEEQKDDFMAQLDRDIKLLGIEEELDEPVRIPRKHERKIMNRIKVLGQLNRKH